MNATNTVSFWLVFLLFISSFFALPAAARAAVAITEVMYNPQGADSGREWVELYNTGDQEVVIVGGSGKGSWRIVDSSNHTITDPAGGVGRGSLTIPAGGYLILASDPATVMSEYEGDYPVAKASLTLNNTGTTVSLVDGDGNTVSSVTYDASQGGDDNGTSLQLASSTWLQALPTPGVANATERYEPPQEERSSSGSSSSSSKSSGIVSPPVPGIFADAGKDRTVIVGAATKLVALAYDRDRDIINYAKFSWNFGDGTTAEGPEVMHHWSYPGRYLVDLIITNTEVQSRSHVIITAEPASVLLVPLPRGGVSIQNRAGRDLDLSFWEVKEGEYRFVLPERSVALRGAAINISAHTLGFEATEAKLYYPNGTEVLPVQEAVATAPQSIEPTSELHRAALPTASSKPAPTFAGVPAQAAASTTSTTTKLEPAELGAAVGKSDAALSLWASLAGLTGLVGAGIVSAWAIRRKSVTQASAEGFTIE